MRPASLSRNQKPVFPASFANDTAFDAGTVISKATRTATDVTDREAARVCESWTQRDGEIMYHSDDRCMSTLIPKRMHCFGVFDSVVCARAFAESFGPLFGDSFRLDILDEYWGRAEPGDAMWEDGVEFGGDREHWPVVSKKSTAPVVILDRIAPFLPPGSP
jgi:hypothetical protein